MIRTLSVAGTLAVLLLAFLSLRIAGGAGRDAPPPRLAGAATATATTPAAPSPIDPATRALDDLAAWPIAATPGR